MTAPTMPNPQQTLALWLPCGADEVPVRDVLAACFQLLNQAHDNLHGTPAWPARAYIDRALDNLAKAQDRHDDYVPREAEPEAAF